MAWQPDGASSSEAPNEAGLVAETQFALKGLPRGRLIAVTVSARNAAGESAPAVAAIVVP